MAGAQAFARDVPNTEIHLLDTAHFGVEEDGAESRRTSAGAWAASPLLPLDGFALGSLALPNRIVMAPMTRNRDPGGIPGAHTAPATPSAQAPAW